MPGATTWLKTFTAYCTLYVPSGKLRCSLANTLSPTVDGLSPSASPPLQGVLSPKVPVIMPRQFAERVMSPALMLRRGIEVRVRRLGMEPTHTHTQQQQQQTPPPPPAQQQQHKGLEDGAAVPPSGRTATDAAGEQQHRHGGTLEHLAPASPAAAGWLEPKAEHGSCTETPPGVAAAAAAGQLDQPGAAGAGGEAGGGQGEEEDDPDRELVYEAQVEQFFHAQGYSQYRVLGLKEVSCRWVGEGRQGGKEESAVPSGGYRKAWWDATGQEGWGKACGHMLRAYEFTACHLEGT